MGHDTVASTTEVLRALPVPLFTTADLAKFVANPNVFLYRAGRKGYVQKIANRIYWNVLFHSRPPTIEAVACFARQPTYVSGEWALNYHGVLLQVPTVCTAVTLHGGVGRRNRIRYGSNLIVYNRIKSSLYLPDHILSMENALMATAEKALLDTVYLRHRLPFADEMEADALDPNQLRRLARHYPPIVARRLADLFGEWFQ